MDTDQDVLLDVCRVMGSSLELKEVFDGVMRILADRLGIERGRLVVLDDVTGQLRIEAAHGLKPEEIRRGIYNIGEGITGLVYQSGQARILEDVRQDPTYLDRTGSLRSRAEAYSFICLPIMSENKPIGVLSSDKRFVDGDTLRRDVHVLTVVAAMIAQTVCINWLAHHEKEELIDELAELRKQLGQRYQFSNIIGASQPMMDIFRTIDQVARTRATVLLIGETGTGKEMIAKAIHYNSDRADRPFIRVNCGALSGQLLESELFGHVKGAFTGAIRDKIGRFEAANGGTLFLDEITTLDTSLQVKLLRVLQEREFERVGDHRTLACDVRIIAASNLDLEKEVREKRFRDDLYYRLNVVAIRLPPLRERRADIPALIDHFLDKYNTENGRSLRRISRHLLQMLLRYPWPGNVRELENTVERAVVLSQGEDFTEDLLPLSIQAFAEQHKTSVRSSSPDDVIRKLVAEVMDDAAPGDNGAIWDAMTVRLERALIEEALKRCEGIKIKAADYLGINRNTLNKKYKEIGLGDDAHVPATAAPQPASSNGH